MMQTRYHTEHYDSQSGPQPLQPPTALHTSGPRAKSDPARPGRASASTQDTGSLVELGQHAGDISTLRFLAGRKLRRFDVEAPSPMSLSLNGRPVAVLQPGENTFEPPIPLNPGDILQLEVIAADDHGPALSGWQSPAEDLQSGERRDGRRS